MPHGLQNNMIAADMPTFMGKNEAQFPWSEVIE